MLAEQAQLQAEDQSFTLADDLFPEEGVERPMEEFDSTKTLSRPQAVILRQ